MSIRKESYRLKFYQTSKQKDFILLAKLFIQHGLHIIFGIDNLPISAEAKVFHLSKCLRQYKYSTAQVLSGYKLQLRAKYYYSSGISGLLKGGENLCLHTGGNAKVVKIISIL